MPGLTFSNEKLAGDEGLHCEIPLAMFHLLRRKPSQNVIHEIVRSAVEAERQFVCESLPVALIGINSTSMTQDIEFIADFLLDALERERRSTKSRESISK